MQDTQPVDMGFSCYWTLTAGHTLGWPQPVGAPGTGHSAMGTSNSFKGGVRLFGHGLQVRPLLDSTRSCLMRWGQCPGLLGHQFVAQGPVRLRAPGHQFWPGDRHSYTQLVRLVATPVKDTGLGGGLTPSVWLDTRHPGRIKPLGQQEKSAGNIDSPQAGPGATIQIIVDARGPPT